MFTYTHTLTKFNFSKHEINVLNQYVDFYLISLIDGLRQTAFGLNTLIKTANNIENLRKKFLKNTKNKKWFIDSGGYSIIVGDVSPRDMSKFIECYTYYLDNYASDNCDYILSLDIPILLKYPDYNNVKYIKKQNYLSCEKSKEILDNKKELYDKFVFVWQFKTPKQYKIWCDCYNNIYGIDNDLKNFAIGGQVGLRGLTGINFSPFIATSFQITDIIYNKNLEFESILHLLGIYGIHDRILMGFLDRLFNNHYLKDRKSSIKITFDTVHHTIAGLFKIRELKSIIIKENQILYDYSHKLINEFHLLIENEFANKEIVKNLNNIVNNEKIGDTSLLCTLEVIKHQMFDVIIDSCIDKYKIVDLFIESNNYNKFKNLFIPIFVKLESQFPYIFKNRLNQVLLNFQYCYAFHDWWLKGRDPKTFNNLMNKFIQLIKFPADLSN